MAKKVTIKDIARELNTNDSTVSRALNDSPLVSHQTKEMVKKKAAEMGYRPNSIARQLREGKSRTLGLLVPRINRAFFANVIHGVETIAKQKGYHLLICQSNDSVLEEREAIRVLGEQNVAGIIMSRAADATPTDDYQEIIDDGIGLVMFDRVLTSKHILQVINDNKQASYIAVKHLLAQGYQRIVHFGGPLSVPIYQERYDGYCQALEEANLPIDPDLIFRAVLTIEAGKQCTQELLHSELTFDAIAATSDFSALGAYQVLTDAGIDLPQQVGLIGFANETFTGLLGISSIEQYSVKMGMTAAQLMLAALQDPQSAQPKEFEPVVIVPKFIPRQSSLRFSTTLG